MIKNGHTRKKEWKKKSKNPNKLHELKNSMKKLNKIIKNLGTTKAKIQQSSKQQQQKKKKKEIIR